MVTIRLSPLKRNLVLYTTQGWQERCYERKIPIMRGSILWQCKFRSLKWDHHGKFPCSKSVFQGSICTGCCNYGLQQWFSTFLMLRPFNTVHVVVTSPPPKLFYCYFITVILLLLWIIMQISVFSDGLRWPLWKSYSGQRGRDPQVENPCSTPFHYLYRSTP